MKDKIKNNKKVITIIISLLIVILLIGGSYALWTYTYKGNDNLINVSSVELEFFESSDVISIPDAVPLLDSDGKRQSETFDFQVKSKTKREMTLAYNIYIEKLEVAEGYTSFNDNEVKVYLTDFNNNQVVAPTLISDLNNYKLYSKMNIHDASNEEIIDKYKLRIWIDDSVTGEDFDENTKIAYSFKLGVSSEERVVNKCNEVSLVKSVDTSNANTPVLSDNMISVYYDTCEEVWKKADESNQDGEYLWYNYDEKIWANSVTVSSTNRQTYLDADPGTAIPMEDILTMQVWIPRYKYTIWNYNADGTATSNPQEIDIQFETGITTTGEIECTDLANMGTSDGTKNGTKKTISETCIIKSTSEACTDSICNNKTYTHPAFTFGDEELEGIWVGKFEVSSDTSCAAANSSAVGAGCNLSTIRPLVKPNVESWRGAMVGTFENNMMAMNDSGNKYGFSTTDDTHMMKNMEWGAVAYLSHSKYGINKEIALNSYSSYKTGCGPQSEGSTSSGSTCNAYNTTLGQTASTTGNIYGVYDMSGGTYEYVMGNIVSPDGETMMSGYADNTSLPNYHSGYSGILYYNDTTKAGYGSYTGTYSYPDNKYYDKYSFNTSDTTRGRSKLGDGVKEVLNTSSSNWYSDSSLFVGSLNPWFYRGGYYNIGSYAGVFNSYINCGNGDTYTIYSSRLVISQ